MDARRKIGIGSPLALVGAISVALAPVTGWTGTLGPWSFVSGLAVGIVTGIGAALCIAGLLERRAQGAMN